MQTNRCFKNMVVEDISLLNASYLISHQIEKNIKPYTIGKELIKLLMLQACEVAFLDKQAVQKLKVIHKSVKRRIEKMAEDIENQVIKIEKNPIFFKFNLMRVRTLETRHFSVVL